MASVLRTHAARLAQRQTLPHDPVYLISHFPSPYSPLLSTLPLSSNILSIFSLETCLISLIHCRHFSPLFLYPPLFFQFILPYRHAEAQLIIMPLGGHRAFLTFSALLIGRLSCAAFIGSQFRVASTSLSRLGCSLRRDDSLESSSTTTNITSCSGPSLFVGA